MTDRELLSKYAGAGEEDAFAELTKRYAGMVHAACVRILGNSQDAEDATQAVFLLLARQGSRFGRGERGLGGWLYAAAVNVARTAKRGAFRRERREREGGMERLFQEDGPASADEAAAWAEVGPRLDEALAGLSKPQRDAIVARYLRGLPMNEAAREMDCPEDTLKTRIRRGLERLKSRLAHAGVLVGAALLATLLDQRARAEASPGLADGIAAACSGKAVPAARALELVVQVLRAQAVWTTAGAGAIVAGAAAGLVIAVLSGAFAPAAGGGPGGGASPTVGMAIRPAPDCVFLDLDRDGRFGPGDRPVPAGVFDDGVFKVAVAEPGYQPPDSMADLVIPAGAARALPRKGLQVSAPRDLIWDAVLRLAPAPAQLAPPLAPGKEAPAAKASAKAVFPQQPEIILEAGRRVILGTGAELAAPVVRLQAGEAVAVGERVRLESNGISLRQPVAFSATKGRLQVTASGAYVQVGGVLIQAGGGEISLAEGATLSAPGGALMLGPCAAIRATKAEFSGSTILLDATGGGSAGRIVLETCRLAAAGGIAGWTPLCLRVPEGELDLRGTELIAPPDAPPVLESARVAK